MSAFRTFAQSHGGPMGTIIIVENDRGILRGITFFIKKKFPDNTTIHGFTSASDAIEIIQQEKEVLLVWTDLHLDNGESGEDVIEATLRKDPSIPIIICSSSKSKHAPGIISLEKPVDPDEISQAINQALSANKAK